MNTTKGSCFSSKFAILRSSTINVWNSAFVRVCVCVCVCVCTCVRVLCVRVNLVLSLSNFLAMSLSSLSLSIYTLYVYLSRHIYVSAPYLSLCVSLSTSRYLPLLCVLFSVCLAVWRVVQHSMIIICMQTIYLDVEQNIFILSSCGNRRCLSCKEKQRQWRQCSLPKFVFLIDWVLE